MFLLSGKKDMSCEVRITESRGHAARLVSDGLGRGFTRFVSLGGDGTSGEVAGSLQGSEAIAGIIPCGTGNDFPKAAGIPLDACGAVENIFSGVPRGVDVAFMDGRCFINGFGVGMDGAVAHAFARGLRRLGPFGYIAGAVIEAFRFRGFSVNVDDVPGEHFRAEEKTSSFRSFKRFFSGRKIPSGSLCECF